MATLVYWVAQNERDHQVYSIIAKTKKECIAQVQATGYPDDYAAPIKRTVIYKDAFDLLDQATNEFGGRAYTGFKD